MSAICLTSSLPFVFLSVESFFYEKTGKTYYNVNLFDRASNVSFRTNCNEALYKDLVQIDSLTSLICDFNYDVNYKSLFLVSFKVSK